MRTSIHHTEVAAPPRLRDAIRCFWHERREFGDLPADFTILPDGYAEIIFHAGGAQLAHAADGQPLPSPFIMGLLDRPVVLRAQGRLDILGVRCYPWTVFDLLGLPPARESVRVFDHPIARLQPVLADCLGAGRPAQALARLQAWFLDDAAFPAVDALLRKAGAALRDGGGTQPVGQVAAAAHASVRTLERKFMRSAGRTVKDVAGLTRFEGVRNRLWLQPDAPIAGLAAEFGFTDQAHLSRDFKRYSGTTPGAFARKARQARWAVEANPVAFLQD